MVATNAVETSLTIPSICYVAALRSRMRTIYGCAQYGDWSSLYYDTPAPPHRHAAQRRLPLWHACYTEASVKWNQSYPAEPLSGGLVSFTFDSSHHTLSRSLNPHSQTHHPLCSWNTRDFDTAHISHTCRNRHTMLSTVRESRIQFYCRWHKSSLSLAVYKLYTGFAH